jgi:hypothetical protein
MSCSLPGIERLSPLLPVIFTANTIEEAKKTPAPCGGTIAAPPNAPPPPFRRKTPRLQAEY